MARYIDAEVLKSRLEDFSRWCKDGRKEGVDFVLDCPLSDTDTADVISKNEIKKIFKELDKLTYRLLNDADYTMGDIVYDITELKNKYTGEKEDAEIY